MARTHPSSLDRSTRPLAKRVDEVRKHNLVQDVTAAKFVEIKEHDLGLGADLAASEGYVENSGSRSS